EVLERPAGRDQLQIRPTQASELAGECEVATHGPVRKRDDVGRVRDGEIMKIGIIGAGQIGGTLTRRLRALGHEVHVANSRDPRTLASLVAEIGAVAVEAKDAPRGVDLVVVTIPERNVPTLPKGLFADVPASVVVVDTGNYYPRQRDGRIV